ncbi:MAG: diguanylate cyclase [Ramlibacter sp.]
MRLLVGLSLALCACCAAAVPEIVLSHARAVVNLGEAMATQQVPATAPFNPDVFWTQPAPAPTPAASGRWTLQSGQMQVGRATLHGTREKDQFVVVVPSSRVDQVQVWHRQEEGDSWKSALAGDRVALSRWPFVGPVPAFPLMIGEKPVDLIVTGLNDGELSTEVLIMPDAMYRELQTRQSVLSGLVMGLGLMVVVVCIIAGFTLRLGASWFLAGVAIWMLWTVMCFNGDTAIWLTPESPLFNDGNKHFTSVVLSALVFAMALQALDARFLGRWRRWLTFGAPAVAVAYAVVQALYLPNAWRANGSVAWALLMVVLALGICVASALAGERYVPLVAGAVLCYPVATAVGYFDLDIGALDLSTAVAAAFLFGSTLLVRHATFSRVRYGRDVLGQTAASAHRDPLTALLSYPGFQLAYDEAQLRQDSQPTPAWVILFLLPGLGRSSADYGFVLTERALVRFAASLRSVLGDEWSIGRLSKTRFACVNKYPIDVDQIQSLATQVLATCSRMSDPLQAVNEFDLRIACGQCNTSSTGLTGLLAQLEKAARSLDGAKRITIV